MDVALLNVKVLFQKNSVEVDEIGNHRNGWRDYYICHATVSGESGNEKYSAGVVLCSRAKITYKTKSRAIITIALFTCTTELCPITRWMSLVSTYLLMSTFLSISRNS